MAALFAPLELRSVTLRNRVMVSPMCQYSSDDGQANDWHLVHLGSRAVGGAGLVMAEATAVSPEGRISPGDAGLWSDAQVEPLARVNRFVEKHGAVAGIQIGHAGRKASAQRPWEGDQHLGAAEGAWPTLAPSATAFGANLPAVPKAMAKEEIARVRGHFAAATKRALAAGYRFLELHFAHGYLAHEFFSPLANTRGDEYGGSFANRCRFLIETFDAVRAAWPDRFPLAVRLSVTDWVDGGVTIEESIELLRQLKSRGLDFVDVSHGFVTPDLSKIPWAPGFMVPTTSRVKREVGLPCAAGWMITKPEEAEAAVKDGHADVVVLAREMLRDPYWPFHAAKALGVEKPHGLLPIQYAHWLKR